MHGCIDEWIDGCMGALMHGWIRMDGWMDVRMDGCIDGWIDG